MTLRDVISNLKGGKYYTAGSQRLCERNYFLQAEARVVEATLLCVMEKINYNI